MAKNTNTLFRLFLLLAALCVFFNSVVKCAEPEAGAAADEASGENGKTETKSTENEKSAKSEEDDDLEEHEWMPPEKDDCEDKDSDCEARILHCENRKGKVPKTMHKRCEKTCGVCVPKDHECKDLVLSETCEAWKNNGFCQKHKPRGHPKGSRRVGKSHYPKAVMLKYCAHTCELCSGGSKTTLKDLETTQQEDPSLGLHPHHHDNTHHHGTHHQQTHGHHGGHHLTHGTHHPQAPHAAFPI